jgi:multiple sugar transport system substrate-binding protein
MMVRSADHRDFFASGFSRETNACLAGHRTRRCLIREFGELTGMLALSSWALPASSTPSVAQERRVARADATTPLGKAQAAAIAASTQGPADGSAFRAVQAAKKFRGATLNLTFARGPQALEPRYFSGPLWEELTGIKIAIFELPYSDLYSKPILEHIARSGAYDVLDIEPAWTPSLADGGVIAPIDDLINRFMNKADLEDYHPLYRQLPSYKGKTWGLFDDGDVFALYYRKDIFADEKLKAAYERRFATRLEVPRTWESYVQVAQFFTDALAPDVYGGAHFRKAGAPGNQYDFLQQYRANGGILFDESMRSQLASPAGLRTLKSMLAANTASILGNNELDAVAVWAAWLQGKVAMIYSWPPTGRMTANYAQTDEALNFVPQSTIADKVGYALVPGNPEHALGFTKALSTGSSNPEAAYLFMQWVTSPPVSLARVMLPYALRDPYRLSHFSSDLYRALWPSAAEYLTNLNNSANVALLDPIMPGSQDYGLALDRMCTAVWAGADPESALKTAAAEWDLITDRLGADAQRAAYGEFKKLPGSAPDRTVERLGLAVEL